MKQKNRSLALLLMLLIAGNTSLFASPWADNPDYLSKTGGKFWFGLKNSLFSWVQPWTEANDPKYSTEWEGFCAGIGKTVVYTGSGLIQLATFPIPVDFPYLEKGVHRPDQNPIDEILENSQA